MKVELIDGNLVITVKANTTPPPSKSGKTNVVATTNGFAQTGLEIDGKPVSVGLNVTVPAK